MNNLISVILPVYNGSKYLSIAIESILNQSYQNLEVIIIDDGSSDNSLKIIRNYEKKDERIIVISRENRGTTFTLNEGIRIAKGKYIAKMDQDDVSLPLRLEKQYQLLEQANGDICGCHYIIMDIHGKILGTRLSPLTEESTILYLSYSVPFAHGSVLIRKSFLVENDILYDRTKRLYAEDYDLWLRMYGANAIFLNVDDFLFKYRVDDLSFSHTNAKENRSEAKSYSKSFIKKNQNTCKSVFMDLLNKSLSVDEQELLVILSIRFDGLANKIRFFYLAIKKVDKKLLPSSVMKSIYIFLLNK